MVFNFNHEFTLAGMRNRAWEQECRREEAEQQRLQHQQRLAEKEETKRQRATVQTKRHKARSIHVAKPKDVPKFLKNLVNKSV
jgi:hypothetical protein